VGIRLKFNLLMLAITALGVGLFALASGPLVNALARDEVSQTARIMLDSASGARKYTAEQIAPLLKDRMKTHFYLQAVTAYAARRNFDVIHAKYPDYSYREAALNPTNPRDRSADWEADIINEFRADPTKTEVSVVRSTPAGMMMQLARPIMTTDQCSECHGKPSAAPASMVKIYGTQNGFDWKTGEVGAAQIVSVPMAAAAVRAKHIRNLFLVPFAAFVLLLFVSVNLLLHFVVIQPITRMAATAEAISMGEIETPEYRYCGTDEIGRLASSFTRMHRSIVEAFRMLGGAVSHG
jgi:protein-histidine pros-kinase